MLLWSSANGVTFAAWISFFSSFCDSTLFPLLSKSEASAHPDIDTPVIKKTDSIRNLNFSSFIRKPVRLIYEYLQVWVRREIRIFA